MVRPGWRRRWRVLGSSYAWARLVDAEVLVLSAIIDSAWQTRNGRLSYQESRKGASWFLYPKSVEKEVAESRQGWNDVGSKLSLRRRVHMGLPFSLWRAEQSRQLWIGQTRRDETSEEEGIWSRGLGLFSGRVRWLIVDIKNVYSEKV